MIFLMGSISCYSSGETEERLLKNLNYIGIRTFLPCPSNTPWWSCFHHFYCKFIKRQFISLLVVWNIQLLKAKGS